MNIKWTPEETTYLCEHPYDAIQDLIDHFDRHPENSIRNKVRALGFKRLGNAPKRKPIHTKPKVEERTKCWDCGRACGGCSWSAHFIPVEGWTAKPTLIRSNRGFYETESYAVLDCPLFLPEPKRKPERKEGA